MTIDVPPNQYRPLNKRSGSFWRVAFFIHDRHQQRKSRLNADCIRNITQVNLNFQHTLRAAFANGNAIMLLPFC
jgi:hypothetical protein